MCQTSSTSFFTTVPVRLSFPILLTLVFLTFVFALVPLAGAAPPEPVDGDFCGHTLPLPLDRSVLGHALAGEPAGYAVEVPEPGLLLVEAHGTSTPSSPSVRLLDPACRIRSSNLSLPAIRGRHLHRISTPGTYFVEVAAAGVSGGSFRIDAWLVAREDEPPAVLAKDGEDPMEGIPEEPMDEWDELRVDRPGAEQATWREIPGHGVLELLPADDRRVRFYTWCPWATRPGLLATFTCGPRLLIDETGRMEVSSPVYGTGGFIAVTLASHGWVALESDAVLFDSRGRLIADLAAGDSMRLAAGRYFLRVETPAGVDTIRLDADLD